MLNENNFQGTFLLIPSGIASVEVSDMDMQGLTLTFDIGANNPLQNQKLVVQADGRVTSLITVDETVAWFTAVERAVRETVRVGREAISTTEYETVGQCVTLTQTALYTING
jgi:hypothetical protein